MSWLDPLGLCQKTPEQLLSELGSFGNPESAGSFQSPGSTPLYKTVETKSIQAYMAVVDAMTEDYGILHGVGTGSSFAGSSKLITYRRYGTDKITNYELEKIGPVKEGLVAGDYSGDYYGWRKVENKLLAEQILKNNPELMERAIEQTKPSGFGKFMENVVEVFVGHNSTR